MDPRFAYVYGGALHSAKRRDEAIATLIKANAAHPADTDILEALVSFYQERGNAAAAQPYAYQLRAAGAAN